MTCAFHGPVSVRAALANSYNIPAVRVLQTIGIDAFMAQSRRHGVTTFRSPNDYGLALTLGGGEITLLQLTAAYAPFAHAGRPVRPIAIARITDNTGAVLFDAGLEGAVVNPERWTLPTFAIQPPVLDPRTAYLITSILSDNDARAPTFGPSSALRLTRPAAAKTGTTTNWRDNWTIGYTPDLLTGVWVGNADNEPMYGVSGVDGAAPIWHDTMTLAHKDIPARDFARPDGLVERDICVPSGLLATPDCPQTARELFIAGSEPTQPDDQYRRIAIDLRTGQAATNGTPTSARGTRIAWDAPPVFRDWAREHRLLLLEQPTPDSRPSTSALRPLTPALQLLSPEPNAAYLHDPRLPDPSQRLQLAVAYTGGEPLARVAYLLDGAAIAEAVAWPWTAWWSPTLGNHTIRAVAYTRSGASHASEDVTFRVE